MTAAQNNAASANTENSTTGPKPVFYTRKDAAVSVALWKNNRSEKDTAPVLTGLIDGKKVAGFLRQGPTNKFIQINGIVKMENGHYEDLGTANVVAGHKGYPKLVIKRDGQEIWVDTTKEGTHEFLESLGLNIELMLKKQAEAKSAGNEGQEKEAA